MKGHLDGFLVDPNTMQSFVKKYHMQDEFEQHSMEIYSADIYIMLSKKTINIDIVDKINKAISTLTNSGELSRISSTWKASHKDAE